MMPQALIDLTFSCQIPGAHVNCEKCSKCKKRKFFCDMVASGKTVREITDYVEQKSIVGGKWVSMKYWIDGKDTQWDTPEWPTSYRVTE
jgi:hypothetical protein